MKHRCFQGACAVALLAIATSSCGSDDPEEHLPKQPAVVVRDDLGVPHIYAEDDEDLFWASGYQTATDRLYQMEMLRRFAYGRLAEVLGDEGVERDRLSRAFDLPRWGREDQALTQRDDPTKARLLHAWVVGINARIDDIRNGVVPRPFGYRPTERDFLPEKWTDADPYVVLKGAGFALDRTIEFEIALTLLSRVYPKAFEAIDVLLPARDVTSVPPEDRASHASLAALPQSTTSKNNATPGMNGNPAAYADAFADVLRLARAMPRASGSNNWAVSGRFTKNKKPLIAGDPHLSFDFFGAPYPLHLSSKHANARGTFDVAGFAYPGTPGIALGHNDRVAWTATSAFADVTDVWEVVYEGDGVKMGSQIAPITLRQEKIRVRALGGLVGEGRVEEYTYEDVAGWGVILPRDVVRIPVGGPFLVGWTGFKARPAQWFMELNRTSSIGDFEAAVDRMREMNYSFVGADASSIAYRVGVEVPIRAADKRPWLAMRGDDPTALWSGAMLEQAKHPHGRANERGWIGTANNDPLGFVANGRADDDPWYFGAFFDPGYRASRIASELGRLVSVAAGGGAALDVTDMQAMQQDTKTTLADDLLPVLADANTKIATDPALAEMKTDTNLAALVALLASWDRRMVRDSNGALAFQALLHFTTQEVLKDDIELGYDLAIGLQSVFLFKIAVDAVRGHQPRAGAIMQGGRDLVLLRAAQKTATWLASTFGGVDKGKWSDRKNVVFDHALGFGVPLYASPSDGGEDTLNVSQNISFSTTEKLWKTSYVPVEKSVMSFGDDGVPQLWTTFPMPASADSDMQQMHVSSDGWIEGRYVQMPFRRADVDARAKERTTLAPR